ncbi:TerD family protein [Paenibacillus qinlingensis]|uniref:Tellurite resistance protein TerA n=1 Tax=Paenibacillus qinlingensis TaxID=1837343 RepID=A0ABU1P5L6_9BACL|nr:TerD family protein [Paenibacillus qinlingensis]MDR6554993.1 tellurite resistance protein TerA [Paenibacillus qinlingensis]
MSAVAVIKGQKVDVTKVHTTLTNLAVFIGWETPNQIELDTSAFLLAQNNKVRGDEDLIFYGNPSNSFMTYIEKKANERELQINLKRVQTAVDKMAFTLTIYESEARRQNFSQIRNVYIRFANQATGQEILRYDLGNHFSIESAIVIGELYRYNGEWKFGAIGAGYAGGLKALCQSYGVVVNKDQQSARPEPEPKQSQKSEPEPELAKLAPIKLSKIELTKKGDKINLEKKSGNLGEILINLNWNQKPKEDIAFWIDSPNGIDLDLACLYELKDGSKGLIQALGNTFGSLTREPFIALDGDDRTGSVKTGENIRINGTKLAHFKRILIFTFIYEGVSRWSEADGLVTVKQNGGPDIIVKLDEHENDLPMCAIALIQNVNDETLSIERIVRHFKGHPEMDQAYNWGLRWVVGSK